MTPSPREWGVDQWTLAVGIATFAVSIVATVLAGASIWVAFHIRRSERQDQSAETDSRHDAELETRAKCAFEMEAAVDEYLTEFQQPPSSPFLDVGVQLMSINMHVGRIRTRYSEIPEPIWLVPDEMAAIGDLSTLMRASLPGGRDNASSTKARRLAEHRDALGEAGRRLRALKRG